MNPGIIPSNFSPAGQLQKESRQTEDIKSRRKSRCAVLGYIYLKIDVNSGIINTPNIFLCGEFHKKKQANRIYILDAIAAVQLRDIII